MENSNLILANSSILFDKYFLQSLILWLLFVLVPMIPALVIYKLFPKDRVGVRGLLGSLTINASGAFGAYIISAFMGYFLVESIQSGIEENRSQSWSVTGHFVLYDIHDNPIPYDEDQYKILQTAYVTLVPNLNTSKNKAYLNLADFDRETSLLFQLDRYQAVDISLNSDNDSQVVIDSTNRHIEFGEIIFRPTQELTEPYDPTVDVW